MAEQISVAICKIRKRGFIEGLWLIPPVPKGRLKNKRGTVAPRDQGTGIPTHR